MAIEAVYIRNFRSLQAVDLVNCGQINVLIGKNNSGKSTVLNAIEIALSHLGARRVATRWSVSRPSDDFTERDTSRNVEIGLNISISAELNKQIRDALKPSAIGMDAAVAGIAENKVMSAVISISVVDSAPVIFVKNIATGPILWATPDGLDGSGVKLFSLTADVAAELVSFEDKIDSHQRAIGEIDEVLGDPSRLDYVYRDTNAGRIGGPRLISGRGSRQLDDALRSASSPDEARQILFQRRSYLLEAIEEVRKTATQGEIQAFAGVVHTLPDYVKIIMEHLGKAPLHFRERREAIGPEEAQQLLQLKTRRGGTERLTTLQKTIRSLLGVSIDAFEGEASARTSSGARARAEMDIDNFLVEANGAGIREALRIILDLELKSPAIALIEEPEVHLHPGLERVMHSYLTGRSAATQIFLATHSTSFLDTSFRQNIFILARERSGPARITRVASEEDALRAAAEVGLRPSSVLMFDKLIFVEGPTDEAVVREFVKKLELDFVGENIGFVQMGGATKFAHYAADATMDLLSKRQIHMWFLIDRDEKGDKDIERIVKQLGDRARLVCLSRREVENYLMVPKAIRAFLLQRGIDVSEDNIGKELQAAAQGMKERVIELRSVKALCQPIFVDRGKETSTKRLEEARATLEERIKTASDVESAVRENVEKEWKDAELIAPGSEILAKFFEKYGVSYKKATDGPRLAEFVEGGSIDAELVKFLREVVAT